MKEYLKMSYCFDSGEVLVDGSSLHDASGAVAKVFGPVAHAEHVAHAINSHDELVEMNKELLKTLKNALKDCEFEISHCGHVCVDTYAIRKAIEMAEGGAA